MSGRTTAAVTGAVLGIVAGAMSIGAALSVTGAVLAAILNFGVAECATFGMIVGSIVGFIGGAIGGWYRGGTGRPAPIARVAVAFVLAPVIIWGLIWGTNEDHLVILVVALVGLSGGVAVGDRVAWGIIATKPTTPSPLREDLDV